LFSHCYSIRQHFITLSAFYDILLEHIQQCWNRFSTVFDDKIPSSSILFLKFATKRAYKLKNHLFKDDDNNQVYLIANAFQYIQAVVKMVGITR